MVNPSGLSVTVVFVASDPSLGKIAVAFSGAHHQLLNSNLRSLTGAEPETDAFLRVLELLSRLKSMTMFFALVL